MNKVIVYTAKWCGYCKSEIKWLQANKVPHEVIDIEEDLDSLKALEKQLGQTIAGVPVTMVGDELIRGFDRPKLKEALGL